MGKTENISCNGEPILKIIDLCKSFSGKGRGQTVHAVNHVTMEVQEGEILGIVGESGCGKSTLARTIIQLYQADSGEVIMGGRDLTKIDRSIVHQECKEIQMVFQDPYASLNPKMTVRQMLREILGVHHICLKKDMEEEMKKLIDMVGLTQDSLDKYPSQFSGGQRQRIGIARALALSPKIIIADEPVSALDVSIQAQIINLLKDLQRKLKLTVLFISHDLGVVRYIADRIQVMYLGEVVESGETEEVFNHPAHPYTRALLQAVPVIGQEASGEEVIYGEPPSPVNLPSGCFFASRCRHCSEKCNKQHPQLIPVNKEHEVACYYFNETKERENEQSL